MSDSESYVSACATSENEEEAWTSPGMPARLEEVTDSLHQTGFHHLSEDDNYIGTESSTSCGSDAVPRASSSRTSEQEDTRLSQREDAEEMSESPEEIKVR
jgi:hypothetical protein